MRRVTAHLFRSAALALAALVATALPALAQDEPPLPPGDVVDPHAGHAHGPGEHGAHDDASEPLTAEPRTHTWPEEAIDLIRRVPIQDEGRIKPFDTFAGFTLLRFKGTRSITVDNSDGSTSKLDPTTWLLDVMLAPEVAIGYRAFVVEDVSVLEAEHFDPPEGRKRRDRFSYAELAPVRRQIALRAAEWARIDEKKRTAPQSQLLVLDRNLRDFESLTGFVLLGRLTVDVEDSSAFEEAFDGATDVSLSDTLRHAARVRTAFDGISAAHGDGTDDGHDDGDLRALSNIAWQLQTAFQELPTLALLPPSGSVESAPEYLSIPQAAQDVYRAQAELAPQIEVIAAWEGIARNLHDPAALTEHARSLYGASTALAEARGEAGKIGLEVVYYRLEFVYYSLWAFVAAFLLAACSWIWTKSNWLARAVPIVMGGGALWLTCGIVLRCVIRSRPPVTTLYETILFITAVCVFSAMVVEWLWPRRVIAGVASLTGAVGMFFAYKFEIEKGVDTMPQLVAVLDTNFWLATHVTTVNIGYAAGLIAGFVGHVYIIGKALGLKRNDGDFYRAIGRSIYGLVCFGLLFSVLGTVLGGIWANDSWGRFWGWDPKENGALMIVLGELIILHARLGGYVRDFGLALLSSLLTVIVAFSWWHVNLLGVGLHAYGFTEAVQGALYGFYGFEGVIALTGFGYLAWTKWGPSRDDAPPSLPPVPPALPGV